MQWQLEYSGYIWPMLASTAFMWALAAYTWRHRAAPGAVPLSFGMFLVGLWALVASFEASSADLPTRLFWFRLKNVVGMPAATSGFCFALEYSGLGKWVSRRNLALLLVPSVAIFPMMFMDDSRALWTQYWVGENIHRALTPMGVAMNVYGVGQIALATAVIAGLFVRSPLHRPPAAVVTLGHLGMVVAVPLETLNMVPDTPLDLSVLSADFMFAMYVIALYRFRIFDVVPVARETVLERMVDGMLVLDAGGRIADLNPAAQELLGAPRSQVVGKDAALVLASFPDLARLANDLEPAQVEALLGTAASQRWYYVSSSPLTDRRGFRLGRLILLQDVTEQKRARELVLEQERTLSVLQERERLARELHDGLGQMLAASHLQATAARRLLAQGAKAQTDECLDRLAEMTLEAEADVREYLLGAKTAFSAECPFFPSLRQYLGRFSQQYGLKVELTVPPDLEAQGLATAVEVQLLRIVQEALSNVRKHARAHSAHVSFAMVGARAQVTIADDGQGFDPALVARQSEGFGLRAMRERAEGLGATLAVISSPGQGTQVVVEVAADGRGDAETGRYEDEDSAGRRSRALPPVAQGSADGERS